MFSVSAYRLVTGASLRLRVMERPRFSGAAAIAQVLDPTHRRLSELLSSGSARNLSEAFQQLNPSEQNTLRERWGRSLDELISLSNERDTMIFQHGLLEVGHRLEDSDQLDLASGVYSALVAGNSPRPPLNLRGGEGSVSASSESSPPLNLRGGQEGLLPGVLAHAQSRLNAINGVGDWRTRLAFNLERLPTNATRWDMLFAMGGAGLVFRGVRLAATARWASSFESAFALNAAAASSAFLAETAAFTSLGRLFGMMAGNHYDWSAAGTFNEWAGGAAMLLGLKAMGGIFGNLSERWAAGETAFARVTRAVAPQAGMFFGIVLGNRLAELGGFHPERHGDTWLTDGLTTLLEFNIAGRLQRSAGGPGLTNLEGRMEADTRSLVSRSKDRLLRGERLLRGVGEVFAPSWVTPEGIRLPSSEPLLTQVYNMQQTPWRASQGSVGFDAAQLRRFEYRLSQAYPMESARVRQIMEHVGKTRFFHDEATYAKNYRELWMQTLSMPPAALPPISQLERASEIFRHVLQMDGFRSGTGSVYEHLLQVALERTLQSGRPRAFQDLLGWVSQPNFEQLEAFFVRQGWQAAYRAPTLPWYRELGWSLFSQARQNLRALSDTPLSLENRRKLEQAFLTLSMAKSSAMLRDPEDNYLNAKGGVLERGTAVWEAGLKNLLHFSQNPHFIERHGAALNQAVQRASESALPLLYFDRLFKVLALGDLSEKIHELGSFQKYSSDELRRWREGTASDPDDARFAQFLDGSIYTGFVADPVLAEKFARYYDAVEYLSFEPQQASYRREFHQLARRLLSEQRERLQKAARPGSFPEVNFGREEILAALDHRPTDLARRVRQSVLDEQLDLEVYSYEQIRDLWDFLDPAPGDEQPPHALILPAAKRPLLPDGSRPTRPLIAVRGLDPALSFDEKVIRFVDLPAFVVHEYEHYLHHSELSFRTVRGLLHAEMRAWLEEAYFRLHQGAVEDWHKSTYLSPLGFGVYLRNLVDKAYFQGQRDFPRALHPGREGT